MSDIKKLFLALGILTVLWFGSDFLSKNVTNPNLITENGQHKTFRLLGGAYASMTNDGFQTIQGALDKDDMWRTRYLRQNPLDTESGYYPQNVFRLVTREGYADSHTEVYFNIKNINTSNSPNKSESNGVFLFSRHTEVGNYYMAGLDVAGRAVLKKRLWSTLTTLGEKRVLETLPLHTDFGLRLETRNDGEDVILKLYVDLGSGWELVLEARDTGEIIKEGYAGLRSDFMDVVYKNFKITMGQ